MDHQLIPVTKKMLDGHSVDKDVDCFDLCDIVRLKLTTFVDSLNADVMNDDSGYFLGVCVTSLFILPINSYFTVDGIKFIHLP